MDNTELDFERARFEYILKVHENLNLKRIDIERKAAFQLLVITLLLGFIFVNGNAISRLNEYLMTIKDIKLLFFSNVLAFVLAVSIILSLTFIIIVLFRSRIPDTPPKDLLVSVYFPDSETSQKKDATFFYQRIGVSYSVINETLSAEINRNDSLVRLSMISLAASIFIMGMLIVAYTIGMPIS